jgi:hypothetical protein
VDSIFISSRSILKHDFKPVLSFSESERDLWLVSNDPYLFLATYCFLSSWHALSSLRRSRIVISNRVTKSWFLDRQSHRFPLPFLTTYAASSFTF